MSCYRLSSTLSGHDEDVRGVISPSDNLIISVSRDGTVRFWDKLSVNKWSSSTVNYHTGSYINSLAWFEAPTYPNYVVSGGAQAVVNLTTLEPNTEPKYALIGHKSNISCLDTWSDLILSGSWDSKAIVWKDFSVLYELTGHENSVWGVKILGPDEFLTCSADKTIRKWKGNKQVAILEGHTDSVRALAILPNGDFASCSNDSTIKIWDSSSLKCVKTLKGHESFVYSLTVLENGDLVSCGEDRTIRVWKDYKCFQVITLPCQTVWSVSFIKGTNTIVAGSDDNRIRIFSTNPQEYDTDDNLQNFDEEVSSFSVSMDSIPDLKKDFLASIDILKTKIENNFEGELIYVKTYSGTVESYRWSAHANKWCKVANVIEGSSTSKRKEYQGKMYDFVMDVDVQEGAPPLKLAFNASDNPYTVADEFLSVNELPASYREEVVRFILQNTGNVNITEASSTSHNTSVVDDDAYSSRVYNPYMSSQQPSSATASNLHVLPQKSYLTFKDIDINKVFNGLKKINATQSLNAQLKQEEISELLSFMENKRISQALEYVTRIIKSWTDNGKLVGFDLLRILIIDLSIPTDDLIDLIKLGVESKNSPKTILVALRSICNMFVNVKWGEQMLNDADVLDILFTPEVYEAISSDKLCSVAASSLILNFVVLMTKFNNTSFYQPLLNLLHTLTQNQQSAILNNSESLYRLLIAYGTLCSYKKSNSIGATELNSLTLKFKDEARFKELLNEISIINK